MTAAALLALEPGLDGDGTVVLVLRPGSEHARSGVLDSAMVTALADAAMAEAVARRHPAGRLVAVSLHLAHLRPVPLDVERLSCAARVVRAGTDLVHVEADLRDDDRRGYAHATAIWRVYHGAGAGQL